MQLAAHGRFGQDPRPIDTSTGKSMAVASIAVTLSDRRGEERTQWLGVVAFGKLAELLLRHAKGEMVSVAGRVQVNTYTANGEERTELQIIADSIVSARTVRPGGGRPKPAAGAARAAAPGDNGAPFDDPLPPDGF